MIEMSMTFFLPYLSLKVPRIGAPKNSINEKEAIKRQYVHRISSGESIPGKCNGLLA